MGSDTILARQHWPRGWDAWVSRVEGRFTENKIFRAVKGLKARLKRLAFPLYRGTRSNHLYTQHQHLVLLVLRQWMGKSYREFCEWMSVCTALLRAIGLARMPHFTTLQKFTMHVEWGFLDRLLGSYAEQLNDVDIAVDSTGFSCTSASQYYINVLRRNEEKDVSFVKKPVRRHLKQTIAVDMDTQLIMSMREREGPGADAPDMLPVLGGVPSTVKVRAVVADKGYDSKEIRRYIWYHLGAETHIPLRKPQKRQGEGRSMNRRRQEAMFDEGKYRRRSLVETVHSVLKRLMRSDVLARSRSGQHVEMGMRVIAYNERRTWTLGHGFY